MGNGIGCASKIFTADSYLWRKRGGIIHRQLFFARAIFSGNAKDKTPGYRVWQGFRQPRPAGPSIPTVVFRVR
jgi:hypothetical protein